jgi:hypothetical protein
MGKRADIPPVWTGEAIRMIKKLARERFLEQMIGNDEEFEELWDDAFRFNDGKSKPPRSKSSSSSSAHT